MCDTQVLISDNGIWFAKNSDREPQEPQAVVYVPAVRGDATPRLRTTHVEIAQVPDRHALILSKPCWIWGAEMGVNAHGLVIGNEAIFSRQRTLAPGLLGMDLLRLGLERAADCRAAIAVITGLLEAHGQGGSAGYHDKSFHYDSSFILADPREAWVLETAGRQWVARQVKDFAAISNALSIGSDYTLAAKGVSGDFREHDSRFMPFFAASHQRQALSLACLGITSAAGRPDFTDLARHLRTHRYGDERPLAGSNADICMHAAGPIRRSQTTGSMIAWLGAHGPRVLVTGTSAPCLSLFRPVELSPEWSVLSPQPDAAPLWQRWDVVHRTALFHPDYRARLRDTVIEIEKQLMPEWMAQAPDRAGMDELVQAASEEILAWRRPRMPKPLTPARRLWARQVPLR